MTARWTGETFSLVCEVLFEADGMPDRDKAMDVLKALADAGVLVEPGSETREEWGVRYPNFHPEPVQMFDEAMARRSQSLDPARVILSRTVRTSPWRETSDGH